MTSETSRNNNLRLKPPGANPPDDANPPPETPTTAESPSPQTEEPPTTTTTGTPRRSSPLDRLFGRDSDSDSEPFADSAPPPTTTSTRAFTDEAEIQAFVDKTLLGEDLAEGLLAAAEAANDKVAPGTPLLIADQREAEGIANPLARIITRHMPPGLGGPGNPDLADAMAAGITLVRYARRQIRLYFEIKRVAAAGAGLSPDETTEGQAA